MTADKERAEAADLLSRFLSGDVTPWEFDDFTSCRSTDPMVEAVRCELLSIPEVYPPSRSGHYTNEEGASRIARLADRLRGQ